jgi:hypothetical protein
MPMKLGRTLISSAGQTQADNNVSDWAFIELGQKHLASLRSTQTHETLD